MPSYKPVGSGLRTPLVARQVLPAIKPSQRTSLPGVDMKYLTGLTAALVALGAVSFSHASSHREAPFIAGQPKVDATDFYMFRSYEPGRQNFVTFIANYQPFQDPQGGPNFYMFDPNALYEISIDNNGDGAEDVTLQFQFNNTSKNQALPAGN